MHVRSSIHLNALDRIEHTHPFPDHELNYLTLADDIAGEAIEVFVQDLDTADRLVAAATQLRDRLAERYQPASCVTAGMKIRTSPADWPEVVEHVTIGRGSMLGKVLVRTNAAIRSLPVGQLVEVIPHLPACETADESEAVAL